VVFLDEPTAGLIRKCGAKSNDIIEELKKEKKTILLTTHYIEEPERLVRPLRSWTTAMSSPWARHAS